MDLTNFLYHIWVLQLFVVLSKQNQILNYFNNFKLKGNNSDVDKVTVNIIRNCYCENANTVLSGDWSNNDIFTANGAFSTIAPLYKVGIREDRHFKRHKRLKNVFKLDIRVVEKKKYPSNSFILMISSKDKLTLTLKILKESILWNHEGFFLIVYKNNEDRCSSVKSLLYLAWKFRLLYVTLLCYDADNILRLFTFNPFMQFAPKFWKFVESHAERESTWSLYQHELYSSSTILDSSVCKNLNFDKTRDLGGYAVRMGAYLHPRLLSYDNKKTGMHRFGGVNGAISLAVWSFLNASPRVAFYVRPDFVDDNGSLQSVLQDLLTGKIEFSMNVNLMRDFWRLQSYPHDVDGLCLVSRKAPVPASLRRLLRPRSWPLLLAAGPVLVAVLKLLTRRGLSTAALELTRLLLAAPARLRPRRFLALLALAATLTASYFRGELTALDATSRPSTAIDTQADLLRSGLPVYGLPLYGTVDYGEVFRYLSLKHRYHYGNFAECSERLARGEKLACVTWCYQAMFNACEGDVFHLSKGIRESYLAFSTAEDWPLYSRFNQILLRMNEGGLIKHYKSREADRFQQDKNNCFAKVVNNQLVLSNNMQVSLYIWSFGVVTSMLVFFLEICLYTMKDHLLMGWKRIRRIF